MTLSAEEARELFMPQVKALTKRAMVTVPGVGWYYHKDLEHFNGETVIVQYDIHDASVVWVSNIQGQRICAAEFEGNKRDMFPVPFIERARQKRAQGRMKRLNKKMEEVKLEAMGLSEAEAGTFDLSVIQPQGKKETPIFQYETDRDIWELENRKED